MCVPRQLVLGNLSAGTSYLIQAAARSGAGEGPLCQPVRFQTPDGGASGGATGSSGAPDPRLASPVGDVVGEVWFIAMVGTLTLLALSVFVAVVYWKRKQDKKKALGTLTGERCLNGRCYLPNAVSARTVHPSLHSPRPPIPVTLN